MFQCWEFSIERGVWSKICFDDVIWHPIAWQGSPVKHSNAKCLSCIFSLRPTLGLTLELEWISQNLPANEATGHPLENLNKRKNNNGAQKTQTLPIVHCGSHALEVTNLNTVASNLLRTCFKSKYLPNSIIFITELHLHVFLTLCSSSNLRKSLWTWQRTSEAWSTRSSLDHKNYICNCVD